MEENKENNPPFENSEDLSDTQHSQEMKESDFSEIDPGTKNPEDLGEDHQEGQEASGSEDWKSEVEKLKAELSELKDQYLRKQADFDNYRKRMQKEKQESIQYGNTRILEDLVEVMDNFERALKSTQDSKDFDNFHQGIVMIEQQFTNLLDEKYGLKKIDCQGQEFDPTKHEAIAMDGPAGEQTFVLEEFQKGYMLHDRVIRSAKVKVGPTAPLAKDKK